MDTQQQKIGTRVVYNLTGLSQIGTVFVGNFLDGAINPSTANIPTKGKDYR